MNNHMLQQTDQYEILIVDDTRDSLELLNRILEERGYRVRLATNGRLALKSVAARLPNLILLDVKMPDMDGYEVCRRLKSEAHSRNVPVIFISAFGETTDKVEGFKAGGVDYVAKPFEREEVLARVGVHLRLRELTEHLGQEVDQRTAQLNAANARLQGELAERQRAEAAVRESEERFRAVVENSPTIVFTFDRNGVFTLSEGKGLKKLGLAPGEVVGKSVFEVYGHNPGVIKNFNTALAGEDAIAIDEEAGFSYETRWTPIRGEDGEVLRVIGVSVDVTESKLAEKELKKHRDHLEEMVKERTIELEAANKELQGFTYSVSHDLRAPLRHIDGFLEILQKKIGSVLDAQSRRYMDNISEAAQKMARLVDDLLSFSRMGDHAMSSQPVNLGIIVRDVIADLEPDSIGRNIDWRLGDLPAVKGDATMLRSVMENLISNALKFTRPRQQAQIEIGSQPGQEAEAVIFVRDNGVGFDMAYADKLFGVFQRLHRTEEFEGTGIGLANVRRIINRHGGRVWAEGKVGQGATFSISLPNPVEGGVTV